MGENMDNKIYLGSNLKMYKNVDATVQYLRELTEITKDISREEMELFILPSFTSLESSVRNVDRSLVKLGAQNVGWEEQGAFTGEISPLMLREFALDMVMIGHSERRHVFREHNEELNQKALMALKHGLTVLLCVGETASEKDFGVAAEVLRTQLKMGLHQWNVNDISNLRIAYEPVWSIGESGVPASAAYAEKMHKVIINCLIEMFGIEARKIPVLYGGSVNINNSIELIKQPSIHGLFVGRSAWDAQKFNILIRQVLEEWKKDN